MAAGKLYADLAAELGTESGTIGGKDGCDCRNLLDCLIRRCESFKQQWVKRGWVTEAFDTADLWLSARELTAWRSCFALDHHGE